MIFTELSLQGAFIIQLLPKGDERGWSMRTFDLKLFNIMPAGKDWVQLNHSFTSEPGTVRGMHFQAPPDSEIKLVRCIAGAVFDVIIDLRTYSPTFLNWYGTELSAENKKMLYIPEGFAHGFQVLLPDTELIYNHSEYYSPEKEGGIQPTDSRLNIQWPLEISVMSERDRNFPPIDSNFKVFN